MILLFPFQLILLSVFFVIYGTILLRKLQPGKYKSEKIRSTWKITILLVVMGALSIGIIAEQIIGAILPVSNQINSWFLFLFNVSVTGLFLGVLGASEFHSKIRKVAVFFFPKLFKDIEAPGRSTVCSVQTDADPFEISEAEDSGNNLQQQQQHHRSPTPAAATATAVTAARNKSIEVIVAPSISNLENQFDIVGSAPPFLQPTIIRSQD